MVDEIEIQDDSQCLDNDDSIDTSAHKNLLGAVSQLYEKKRVKAPTRNEPSLEVSEFHLSQPDKRRGGRVAVTDLAKVLKKRTLHLEIGQKLQTARRRAKTLPKPLEKFHADKITRKAGYEQAKKQLGRWDAIVYQQRVAETVTFPLPKSDDVQVHDATDIKQMFRKPSELEIKLAEVLNQPDPLAKIREEKKREEEDFPLTLQEIIEKRKMLARIRARQSYKDAKAAWKKKIKSKTFRKIERKAKAKEQLKEFEEMQKKDPEAALKKLEELERARAEERMTQRHGSTGRWAKGKAIRAKYDKEARIALAEQLAKKRELTAKLALNKEESEEGEIDETEPVIAEEVEEDPSNPWVLKQSKEMEDFVSGYRKYWETQGKLEEDGQSKDTTVKVKEKKIVEVECLDNEINQPQLLDKTEQVSSSVVHIPVAGDYGKKKFVSNENNTNLTSKVGATTTLIEPTSTNADVTNKGISTPKTPFGKNGAEISNKPLGKTRGKALKSDPGSSNPQSVSCGVLLSAEKKMKSIGKYTNLTSRVKEKTAEIKPVSTKLLEKSYITNKTMSPKTSGKLATEPSKKTHSEASDVIKPGLIKSLSGQQENNSCSSPNKQTKSQPLSCVTKNTFVVKPLSINNRKNHSDPNSKLNNFKVSLSNHRSVKTPKSTMVKSNDESFGRVINDSGSWSVNKIVKNLKSKKRKRLEKRTTSDKLGNTFKVSVHKTIILDSVLESSKTHNSNNSSVVSETVINSKTSKARKKLRKDKKSLSKSSDEPENQKKDSIDEMFCQAEYKLKKNIQHKIDRLSEHLKRKRKDSESGCESNSKEIPSLEMKKSKTTADIDEPLLECRGDNEEENKRPEQILELATAPVKDVRPFKDIDPNKFLKVKPRILSSDIPEIMAEGEDALDDEEKAAEERHMTISEAFADDNVVDEFQKEKEDEGKKNKVADVDLTLPGWGSWAGHNISSSSKSARRKRKKFIIKVPLAPRRDGNRDNIIINEDADKPLKEHQVSTVPFPFTSVKEFEASVRAPLGSTWVAQRAFRRLTRPAVVTRPGAIIAPMDDDQLINPGSRLPDNNKLSFT